MQGGDGGLDLVAAGAPNGQRRLQDVHALGDLASVPQAAVLSVERDDATRCVASRGEAGVVEKHQREQPARLRFVGGECELAGEPDRLAGQVHPSRVAGHIDQVEYAQHDGEVAKLVQAAPLQGALRAADPLRQRRLWHVEGVRDLAGGEAAHGAQGQRHLRGGREVGVAAAEEQEEGVVALLGSAAPLHGGGPRLGVRRLLAAVTGGLAAAGVDEPPGRDRRQPRARVARRVLGPHPQRLQQRLLQRVLGGIEILAPPDQACEHPRDEGSQRALVQPSRRLVDHGASVARGRLGHDLADADPLVQRLPARAGLGGDVGRELERALV